MILITGASGHVGGRIAEILAAEGHDLRLTTRDPARAPELPNSQVVRGDYADPPSLDAAFTGVDAAFIVSGYAEPSKRADLHKNAIDAAVRARVGYLVYLSFQGASPTSAFPMSRDHYETERYLKASGIPFAALRDNLYLDTIPILFDQDGIMRGPAGQGKAAFVAREDVAQVAAALLRDAPHSTAIYDVTGPEAMTMDEMAARVSALVGRELCYIEETPEEGRRWRRELATHDWEVDTWLGSYLATAAGELEQVSDTVVQLTGREPYRLEAYFAERPHLLDSLRGETAE